MIFNFIIDAIKNFLTAKQESHDNNVCYQKQTVSNIKREFKGKSLLEKIDEYVVVDIETTGLSFEQDEIIEFAGLKVRNGIVVEKYKTLIKPKLKLDPFITRLTGISNRTVMFAPSIEKVIGRIESFIGDHIIVAHNAHFDINFLYEKLLKYRNVYLTNDFICTYRLSLNLYKQWKCHKLNFMCEKLNKKYFPTHRANSDCWATYELLQHLYQYVDDHNIDLKNIHKKSKASENKKNQIITNNKNLSK